MSELFDHNVYSFICSNKPATFKFGTINLPSTFLASFDDKVARRVYVALPSGALWRGVYDRSKNCIHELESLFTYYSVKQYHYFVVFYDGGHKFFLEIFNPYGVEIHYNAESLTSNVNGSSILQVVWLNDFYYLSTNFELDKLCGQFNFNCLNCSSIQYDLVIEKQHLQPKIYNKILSNKACNKLGLEDYITSVQIGFKNLMWDMDVHWINGDVFFNKKWCDFAKEGNLCVGDICVFQRTSEHMKFEVAVFEKKNVGNFNKSGVKQGKSLMKWLKMINSNTIQMMEVDVPRVFLEEYGILLIDNVHLLMPDGNEVHVHFSKSMGRLQGLQRLIRNYSIKEKYVIFFDYVGMSHFFLSIDNEKGENLFGRLQSKVLLKDFMRETTCPIGSHTQISMGICGTNSGEGCSEVFNCEGSTLLPSFTMELTSRDVAMAANSVYIGRNLFHIVARWMARTEVTLILGERTWLVEVNRIVDNWRFGEGWEAFITENALKPRQTLNFNYCPPYKFQVYVKA